MQKNAIYFVFLITLFCSCSKDTSTTDGFSEATKDILLACRANPLQDADTIRQQLIGNWKLIGYACSGCAGYGPTTANITFTADGGQFNYKSEFEEVNFNFDWQVEENTAFGGEFLLKTEPTHFALTMSNFCAGYMSHDTRAGSGTLHIYEKQ
ncbi:hypothetical protein [Flavilitoribacter nigricans]|uniref:Lipocalin-like domain-containing protein n=1 Tax=Flavilitoribacter nigricans (strain ATCC 23147 / DSM 23189 / NBRC 102662 / NCIMB 1420 / SS-2) TaxID=1122177 RepID=A0A2D0N9F1_FLAN2|nr:hypothetical protein [Flavilitoribacter nigricans]PHN05000.1 hypothetical protein CRP01_18390 [Flavilitoribacter nigricans DSM 23189 = NBRC 102662]